MYAWRGRKVEDVQGPGPEFGSSPAMPGRITAEKILHRTIVYLAFVPDILEAFTSPSQHNAMVYKL